MSGFWSTTKVYFNTSTSKLVEEVTNPIGDAALEATLRNINISANIQAIGMAGVGASIRRYKRYGENTFIDGMPTVTLNDAPFMVVSKDSAHLGETKPMDAYPMVRLKRDGVYTYDLPDTDPRYITSRRLLRKVSLNMADLDAAIKESPTEAQINDSTFQFSLDLYSELEESQAYMFDFFKTLSETITTTLIEVDEFRANPQTNVPPHSELFVDSDDVRYGFIFDVVSYEQDVDPMPDDRDYSTFFGTRDGMPTYDIVNTSDSDNGGAQNEYRIENTYMTVKKRRIPGDINSPIDGIVIYGVIFYTIADAFGEEKKIYSFFRDKYNPGNGDTVKGISGVRIPLSPDFLPGFKIYDRHIVALDSMLISFVAAEEVDLAWYETGIFKILVIVLSMYLMTLGIGPFLTFLSEASTATFITTALVAVGAGYLIKEILKELDGALGIIVSIAVLVAASYIPGLPATFGGMSLGSQSMFLLSATTSAANTQISIQAEELQEEYEAFTEEAKVKNQELADLAEEFDTDNSLLNLVIASVTADKFAASESFNERVTNVGIVIDDSINQAEIFYKKMLELPTVESMRT